VLEISQTWPPAVPQKYQSAGPRDGAGEHYVGGNVFAFPPESFFTFSPESFSPSPRK
jgi:hypothetical protein